MNYKKYLPEEITWFRLPEYLNNLDSFVTFTDIATTNDILSGGVVWTGKDLEFESSEINYVIGNVKYTIPMVDLITLNPTQPGLDRFDIFAVDILGELIVIEGDESVNPSKPDLIEGEQLEVTFVLIKDGQIVPDGVTNIKLYDENLQVAGGEWNTSINGNSVEADSILDSQLGTISIRYTNSRDRDGVFLTNTSLIDGTTIDNLVFRVKLLELPNAGNRLFVKAYNTSGVDGQGVTINDGEFGFNSSVINVWQTVIVPTTALGVSASSFDRIEIANKRVGSSFFIDNVVLQTGLPNAGIIPDYTLDLVGNNLSLLKDVAIISTVDLSTLTAPTLQEVTDIGNITVNTLEAASFIKTGGTGLNVLLDDGTTAPKNTKTSNFINDGADNTSTFAEHNELGVVATTNDYLDLDNLPTVSLPIENSYENIAALFADQGAQTGQKIQHVTDASGDATVDSGYAYYEYLGTIVGDITDYRKISEEESLDVSNTYVPYTGATSDVNLNAKKLGNVASFNDLKLFAQTGVDVDNISIGINTLKNNLGTDVIAIGTSALENNTVNDVVAIGWSAGQGNTGSRSVFIGKYAGFSNTGHNLSAIGESAGFTNSGADAVLIGRNSGSTNIGADLVSVGVGAGQYNTQSRATFVGKNTGARNRGSDTVGVGKDALFASVGNNCIGIGVNSLEINEGINNTAIGHESNKVFLDDAGGVKNIAVNATDINTAINEVTILSHGFGATGVFTHLRYTTTGTPMSGLVDGGVYFIEVIDANTLHFVLNFISTIGTGVHSFTPQFVYTNTTSLGANTQATKSNQVVLGDGNVTEVYTDGHIKTHKEVQNDTTTTYELVLADRNSIVTMDNAAANILTIPANVATAFPIGTPITLVNKGAGITTIAITTDTLNQNVGGLTMVQYDKRTLTKISITEWILGY